MVVVLEYAGSDEHGLVLGCNSDCKVVAGDVHFIVEVESVCVESLDAGVEVEF